eukprot:156580-Pyramimonas_sp.AAC.1
MSNWPGTAAGAAGEPGARSAAGRPRRGPRRGPQYTARRAPPDGLDRPKRGPRFRRGRNTQTQ